jgi:hypothetical protein
MAGIAMHAMDPLWIPILGIMLPMVLVPTILILKHRTLQKEWQHKERMQAIELGVAPPQAHASSGIAAMGAGVPIAAVVGAVLTTLSYQAPEGEEVGAIAIVWAFALMISAIGMICGLILARIQGRAQKDAETLYAARNGKPAFDPDAFDVVSSRA